MATRSRHPSRPAGVAASSPLEGSARLPEQHLTPDGQPGAAFPEPSRIFLPGRPGGFAPTAVSPHRGWQGLGQRGSWCARPEPPPCFPADARSECSSENDRVRGRKE